MSFSYRVYLLDSNSLADMDELITARQHKRVSDKLKSSHYAYVMQVNQCFEVFVYRLNKAASLLWRYIIGYMALSTIFFLRRVVIDEQVSVTVVSVVI